jgi:uncharacterized protein (DUF1684 family)
MQKKIRNAQRQKVPFMLLAGDEDVAQVGRGVVPLPHGRVAEERRPGRRGGRRDRPNAETLRAFDGIEAFDYDPSWAVPAKFTPYDGPRVEKVLNVDGVVRGLGLDGTVEFELEDGRHSFAAAPTAGGGLWIVFADPTTAASKPFFRFLTTAAPAEDTGLLTLDFNRAYLPPCAFTDHFVCPVPPSGNTLDTPVRVGELAVKTR